MLFYFLRGTFDRRIGKEKYFAIGRNRVTGNCCFCRVSYEGYFVKGGNSGRRLGRRMCEVRIR